MAIEEIRYVEVKTGKDVNQKSIDFLNPKAEVEPIFY